MRRAAVTAAVLGTVLAAALPAQTPRGVSPFLRPALGRDTAVAVWLLARPGGDLDRIAADAARQGAVVRHISRFVQGVSVRASGLALSDLARIPGLRRVQPVGIFVRRGDGGTGGGAEPVAPAGPRASAPDTLYGANAWAIRQLNINALHTRGIRGAGVRIAILDAGFNTAHPLLAGATVIAQRDFVYDDSVVADQPGEAQGEMSHGTATWSLIAANTPGVLVGAAPDAEFLLAKTEYTRTETRTEEDDWVAAVEWAVGLGAQIISTSLGYLAFDNGFGYTPSQLNGDFAVSTIAADSAAARGVLVVASAGNDGPGARTLGTPADGDSVIAVGATDSLARVTSFSSRGPTGDGRIKPDVVAPGFQVTVARIDSGLTQANGTSFAAPLVAGLAALVQEGRGAAPALDLRLGLLQAASSFETPDNTRGYGIPDALRLFAFPSGVRALLPVPGTQSSLTPTFTWDAGTAPAAAGPNVYRLHLARDSALTQVLLDTVVATAAFTMPRPLPPQTRLWWRVSATSGLGVAESTAVIGPIVSASWVRLVTLADPAGASIRDSLPLFVWRSPQIATPPGPFVYDVDVYPASRSPLFAVASARGLLDTTFRPVQPLERNLPFRWRVVAHVGPDSVIETSAGTFLVLDESVPAQTVLYQNFPNPFPNLSTGLTSTCIWFDIALDGEVRLEIFDLRGRLVRRLVPTQAAPSPMPAGRYGRPEVASTGTCDPRFAWDGVGDDGQVVRPGVYVVRLQAGGFEDSRRIVFEGRR